MGRIKIILILILILSRPVPVEQIPPFPPTTRLMTYGQAINNRISCVIYPVFFTSASYAITSVRLVVYYANLSYEISAGNLQGHRSGPDR